MTKRSHLHLCRRRSEDEMKIYLPKCKLPALFLRGSYSCQTLSDLTIYIPIIGNDWSKIRDFYLDFKVTSEGVFWGSGYELGYLAKLRHRQFLAGPSAQEFQLCHYYERIWPFKFNSSSEILSGIPPSPDSNSIKGSPWQDEDLFYFSFHKTILPAYVCT